MIDLSDTPEETDRGPVPPPPDAPVPVTAPPGFRLDGLLGTGGMSVVYAATQLALKRSVAVKYLRPDLPVELRTRFQAEATAVAALDHPNVVRLYAVGEHAGRPYLVLELVPDGSLAQRLRDGPLTDREAATTVRGIASGIAAAHAAGIVHRDLKPANVLLVGSRKIAPTASTIVTPVPDSRTFGELVPKVSDFGLAKHTADPAGPTAPGTVLGTPSYMAPEQTTGQDDIGPAADVYALGAVLYECLTGRPPFRAATALQTLDLVRTADPVPPRQLQPGISRDVETIALKCLRKEPAARYATAAEVADDLNRYLNGETIRARPVGWIEWLVKLCKRRPDRALFVAVAAAGIVAALVAGAIYSAKLKSALDAKTAEEARARQEKERADENYRQARVVLRKMLDRASDKRFADVPRAKELFAVQAAAALDYFRTVADQRDDPSPEVRYDAACAELEAYDMYSALGDNTHLEACARRAKAGFESVVAATGRRDARLRKAEASSRIALSRLGKPDSIVDMEEAVRELTALVAEPGATRLERTQLGGMENNLGHVHYSLNDLANAGKWFRAAYDRRVQLVAEDPADRETTRRLAENASNLVNVYQSTKRPAEAAEMNDVVTTTLEKLLATDRTDRPVARLLAISRVNYSYTQRLDDRLPQALAALTASVADLEPFYRIDPTDNSIRDALFKVHGVRGECHALSADYPAGVRDAEKVVGYAANPGQARFQRWFLARARTRAGQFAAAVADLEENLRQFPADGNWAEPVHGADTAGVIYSHLRATVVLGGAASAEAERVLALAVRLLDKGRAAAGLLGRLDFVKEVEGSKLLADIRERDEYRKRFR